MASHKSNFKDQDLNIDDVTLVDFRDYDSEDLFEVARSALVDARAQEVDVHCVS